jgi:hypothetical protein
MDYVVYVDSNNRDLNLFPNSNSYTVYLTTPLRNISKVEVLSVMTPNVYSSQYLTLDIQELRSTQTLVASALAINSKTPGVPNSNAFYGSFAFVPIKAATSLASNIQTFANTSFVYNNEFYSQNYKISTEYPSRIDKLDRLTISWRNAGNGALFYDSTLNRDLGRNMFLLRFETIMVPEEPERLPSIPDPVPLDGALWLSSAEQYKNLVLVAAIVLGLIIVIFARRKN